MTGASFTSVSEPCPAKLNLFLHVLSRRADGYHNLFSLAGFTEFGDVITIHPSDTDRTRLTGPFASVLDNAGGETIIQRLKAMLRTEGVSLPPTEVVIDKQIPLGGGVGGRLSRWCRIYARPFQSRSDFRLTGQVYSLSGSNWGRYPCLFKARISDHETDRGRGDVSRTA